MLNVVAARGPQLKLNTDIVFFTKEDIMVGTLLTYYGRRDPGATWTVTRIWTFPPDGPYRGRRVDQVQRVMDEVEVTRNSDGDRLNVSFSYLSYSSIWRLM